MIAENLLRIRRSLPSGVELLAVSKYHPLESVREAYDAGQRKFGESRAQDLVVKAPAMPADTEWHFIGHLQTNKVRQIMPYVSLIQSLDSQRLLAEVNKEALRIDRTVDVLLQVHVAMEETKFGFSPEELWQLLDSWNPDDTPGVRIRGVMGMASFTDERSRIESDFTRLREAFTRVQSKVGHEADILSMGMSDDRDIAVACGSTMVRVGTDIFGPPARK